RDEDDGETETEQQAEVRRVHGIDLAADANKIALRQRALIFIDNFLHRASYGAEIAVLHVGVEIERAANIVMRDQGSLSGTRKTGDIRKDLRLDRSGRGEWNVFKIVQRLRLVLRRARNDVVVHPVLMIEEDHWRQLRRSCKNIQHRAA